MSPVGNPELSQVHNRSPNTETKVKISNSWACPCRLRVWFSLFWYRYKWVGEIKNHLPRIPKILVVNKWDLDVADKSEELLTNEMINKAKQDLLMDDMIKVSAKTGYNIDELIQKVGRLAQRDRSRRVSPYCRAH